jgi:cytochrome c-type biogenesis protein CcmF
LYAWRAPLLKSQAGFELGARESFLLFNNILLVIAAATVFGGTMAPLIADAAGMGTLSVGPPYFRPTFLLPMLPLLALLSIGVHANWKRGKLSESQRLLIFSLLIAAAFALAIVAGVYADPKLLTLVCVTLGFWIIASVLVDPIDRLRRKLSLSRAMLGMTLAHLGVGLFVISVGAVESYTHERDVALKAGESATVGDYQFRFNGVQPVEGPNYNGVRGEIIVSREGATVATLHPEKRKYWVQQSVMTEAGIHTRYGSDFFVALGDDLGAGRWSVRAQIRPLINLVWLSAFIMAMGGALAASDRRYRLARAAEPATDLLPGTAKEHGG